MCCLSLKQYYFGVKRNTYGLVYEIKEENEKTLCLYNLVACHFHRDIENTYLITLHNIFYNNIKGLHDVSYLFFF